MIYYFIKERETEAGPYNIQQLKNTSIKKETLVWHAGIKEWSPANNIYELKHLFQKKISLPGFAKNKFKKILGMKTIKTSLKKVS